MGDFGVARDKWVCPNDRELSLRAKLKTGWSVKTSSINSFNKPEQLDDGEQDIIMGVIKRAENLERVEQERVGRLVERLDNMKKNAMGNGSTQCVLCADEFGLLGASPLLCNDCKKAVCTKCGVDTISAQKEPQWLCKICAETRETWKKSGAWFYRGLPKYTLPGKKTAEQVPKYGSPPTSKISEHTTGSPSRSYNSWLQNKGKGSSDKEYTDSSDDEVRAGRLSRRHTTRKALVDPAQAEGTHSPPSVSYLKTDQQVPDSLQRAPSPSYSNPIAASPNVSYYSLDENVESVKAPPLPEASPPMRRLPPHEERETYKKSPSKSSIESTREPHSSPVRYRTRTPVEDEYSEKTHRGHSYRDTHHHQRHGDPVHVPEHDRHRVVKTQRIPSPQRERKPREPRLDHMYEEWNANDASKSSRKKLYNKFYRAMKRNR